MSCFAISWIGRRGMKSLLLLAISLVLSCGKNNKNRTNKIPNELENITIQGGDFSAFNGDFSLKIPPGALDEDVNISVQRIYENLPPGNIGCPTSKKREKIL